MISETLTATEFARRYYFNDDKSPEMNAALQHAQEALDKASAETPDRFRWSGDAIGFICDRVIRGTGKRPTSNLIVGQLKG